MDPLICGAQLPPLRRALHATTPCEETTMYTEPKRESSPPVERKVTAASLATYLGSIAGLAVLQAVDADHSLIAPLPDWLETIALPLIPTALAFLAGYRARHTPRPDLPLSRR